VTETLESSACTSLSFLFAFFIQKGQNVVRMSYNGLKCALNQQHTNVERKIAVVEISENYFVGIVLMFGWLMPAVLCRRYWSYVNGVNSQK